MTFEDKHITVENFNFRIRIHGSGFPLLALHGFSQSAETWDNLDLEGIQVFALDLIGHGKSDKPDKAEPYQLDTILTHIHQISQQLFENQSFILLGYSMGGRLALHYALKYPEQIHSLILESSSLGISDEDERLARRISDEKLAKNIEENGCEWFADFWGNIPLFDSQKSLDPTVQNNIWQSRADNTPHALTHTLRATGQGRLPALADHLQDLKISTLYISGELDTKYTSLGQTYFAKCPSVSTHVVHHAGHNAHLEK
ncbi:MAG: 2-succinyl-6-hydroxy-2,4-cyclohexadiene-1-carboxylate synthase, partial [Streptococcaceae bacterium]|nr:2-succinyl-6-hydroxy-2,4-cyclohexadiene-1-carboxylate synthase [Streptococcaceae bacterium]